MVVKRRLVVISKKLVLSYVYDSYLDRVPATESRGHSFMYVVTMHNE